MEVPRHNAAVSVSRRAPSGWLLDSAPSERTWRASSALCEEPSVVGGGDMTCGSSNHECPAKKPTASRTLAARNPAIPLRQASRPFSADCATGGGADEDRGSGPGEAGCGEPRCAGGDGAGPDGGGWGGGGGADCSPLGGGGGGGGGGGTRCVIDGGRRCSAGLTDPSRAPSGSSLG